MRAARSAVLVADYLISRSGGALTPLQVIKLVYIAHGYSLALLNRPLIEEAVEAWRYGPVVPSVYHSAKKYGAQPIDALLYSGVGVGQTERLDATESLFEEIPPDQMAVLDGVLEAYGAFSGSQLVGMTHEAGSPWDLYHRPRATRIPDDAIKAYYSEVVKSAGR